MFEVYNMEVKEIKKVLSVFKKIKVSKNTPKQVLRSALFESENGQVTISNTDLETFIKFYPEHANVEAGIFTIEIEKLYNVLKPFKKGLVSIVQENDNQAAFYIDGNEIKVEINSEFENFNRYPIADMNIEGCSCDLYPEKFIDFCKRALPFITKDSFMTNLYGVNFEKGVLVAADGYKLLCQEMPEMTIDSDFIVPRPAIEVIKAAKQFFDTMTLEANNKKAVFKSDKIEVCTLLPDAEYPDWRKVMPDPKTFNMSYKLNNNIMPILEIAKNLAETDSIVLKLNGNSTLQVRKKLTDDNNIALEKELPFTETRRVIDDLTIAFNPEKMIDVFKYPNIKNVNFIDQNSMMVANGDQNDTYILMPIRMI